MSSGSRFLNRLRVILDRRLTAANAIDAALAAHPDRRLFHFDGPTGYASLPESPTIRELHAFVRRAGACLARAGLRRFDRVVICKTNSLDYFFLALAVIRAGGIAVPVNSGLRRDGLRDYVRYTGASILIGDEEHFARTSGSRPLARFARGSFRMSPPATASAAATRRRRRRTRSRSGRDRRTIR
jgi:acyl-coenzyme A synthetase/AMP-(fatty) acid ligase